VNWIIKQKCASCWSFSRMCIATHGAENIKVFVIFTSLRGRQGVTVLAGASTRLVPCAACPTNLVS
jgi:hypothetical protein